MKKAFSTFLFVICVLVTSSSQAAEKVFMNAKIYTNNNTFTEAIAIRGNEIIYLGTGEGVNEYIDSDTYVENMDGRLMLPGIHDVHIHPLEASSPIGGGCILDSFESDPENFVSILQNCNLTPNSNGWISGWGHSIFTFLPFTDHNRYPYEILDEIYPNDPVVFMEETSHSVWVNSRAMEILNIDSDTPDPVGGHIIKDPAEDNEPIGILLDNAGDKAIQLAFASTPEIDAQNKAGLLEYGLPLLAQNGITSLCEARTYWKRNYHKIWNSIYEEGNLSCRVVLNPWVYPDDDDEVQVPQLKALYNDESDMLRSTQIKLYSDGIIINATCAMHEDYHYNWNLPFSKGLNYIDKARLTDLITELETEGYDFHIHALGDRGVTESLDAIEAARTVNGDIDARHRLTHLEIVRSSDIPRFAELNVTADMQVVGSFTQPSAWSENNFLVGAARTDSIIPLKAFEEAGARVTLSSDWDVSSLNPFVGMQNALTRLPQEISSIEKAIDAYTIDAAYVMRQESKAGSLELGKWADFIVVDRDIFNTPVDEIGETKVLLTYVDGKEEYRSEGLPVNTNEHTEDISEINIHHHVGDSVLYLDVTGKHSDQINIAILSRNHRLITTERAYHISGQSRIPIRTGLWPPGVYFLRISSESGRYNRTMKFIIN